MEWLPDGYLRALVMVRGRNLSGRLAECKSNWPGLHLQPE